jgi:LacI family repressor for deo operon, udp, cdd, tsx, nupC, and nupG
MADPMEFGNIRKLRQKDIAEKAGVSASTVSILLKNPDTARVSAKTRERIFEIIRENHYTPDARRSEGHIVCAVPVMEDRWAEEFYYTNLLMAAEQTGQRFGYAVQLRSYENYEDLRPLLSDPGVSGIISINSSPMADEFSSSKPVVAVNCVYTSSCDVVKSHHRGCSRDQVEMLVRLGHRRIAFVGKCPKLDETHPLTQGPREVETERFGGYCEGLYAHEIPIQWDYTYRKPQLTMDREEPFRGALNQFLGLPQPPTAIIAHNDGGAFYLVKIAQQLGLQVPRDLSIVGNDNMNPGHYSTPELTTAEQDRAALGQVAVERLIQRIENHTQSPPQIISIPLKLIERESTGPAPAGTVNS